jgi:myo-inositol 2-dehydrogenase/D-chiro-inositol 1-dehydrogenase
MTVRIGVIGVGMIGQDHIRRLTRVLAGSTVVAVTDVDVERAKSIADTLTGCRAHATGQDLISDAEVDAVVVTSWGPTHEEFVLAAIEAGKPVFCEKPLATTQEACLRITEAEIATGKRLVQVGFMRRYDSGYRALRETVASGAVGAPLMMHCAHRIPEVAPMFTSEMVINDAAIHEIDLVRWLFDEEIEAVSVMAPRHNSNSKTELLDPLFVLLEMQSGIIADVEVSANISYGYDIRGEVVGESGTVSLADTSDVVVKRQLQHGGRVPADWRERFIRAYDTEFQEWIDNVAAGRAPTGPTSWDGYAATAVADAALEAMRTGNRTTVTLQDRPKFYGGQA